MKKTLVIISVIICVFYAFWLAGVPRVFDLLKPYCYAFVEENLGYKLADKKLELQTSFLPYVSLRAEAFEVVNPSGDKIVVVKSPFLKVDVLPIFWGQIKLSEISVTDANLAFYLNEPILKKTKVVNFLKRVSLNAGQISSGEYALRVAQSSKSEGYLLTGKEFNFSNRFKKKTLKTSAVVVANNEVAELFADMVLPQDFNAGDAKTEFYLKNFNLSSVYKYFKGIFPNTVLGLEGKICIESSQDALNMDLFGVKLLNKDGFKSVELPSTLLLNGGFKISEKEIQFSKLYFLGEGVNFKSDIYVKNYLSKLPELNITVGVENSKTLPVIKMLPPFSTPDLNLLYLKQYPLIGSVNGIVNIAGKLPEPDLTGDFLIEDAYLVKPILNDKKRAKITLSFNHKSVGYDVKVGAGGEEEVLVNGETQLYGHKISKMTIKSSQNVNLATAKSVVDPLRKILYFETGPVPIMDIKGYGNIDIKVEGNHQDPHVWGRMNFKNATASFIDIKGIELKNANGYLDFDNQKVSFEIPQTVLDGKPFKLTGTCDLFGDLKVNAQTKGFNLAKGLNVINFSPMLADIKKLIPPITKINGLSDIDLEITGTVPNIEDIVFNKNLFAKGNLKLYNTSVGVQDFVISNINGNIGFDNTDITLDALSQVNSSIISLNGNIKNNIADMHVLSKRLNLKDLLSNSAFKGLADDNYISFDCKYKGKSDVVEFDKINLDATVIASGTAAPIVLSSGNIRVKNGLCLMNNIRGMITQNPFVMSAKINHLGKKTQNINADINLKNASLSTINLIREFYLIPKETKELLRKFDFETGKTNIDLKVINNRPYTDFMLNDVSIRYLPADMPIKIINGGISLKNDLVNLSKINTLADDMPIFIDGKIANIYKTPSADIYVNSVPKQSFIDKYLNKNSLYPLKIKGDIIYSAKVKGVTDLYNISANAKIGERSSVYYLGASLGDVENPTIIDFDGDIVKNNSVKINNFEYNKSVLSQNNKPNIINFLKVKGLVKLVNNEPYFKDLVIKTDNATDARIFNVIFKKPNIKQGVFNSDLRLNGKLSDLKILGDFHIYDIDVPLLQTILKGVSLKFLPTEIKVKANGEVFSNAITLTADVENRLSPPLRIKNGLVHFDKLDLNSAISDLKKLEINKPKQDIAKQDLDLAILEIERLDLTADDILIRGLAAKNLKTLISLSDKMLFSMSDYSFKLANGNIAGDFAYNLLNNRADMVLNAENIDANELSIMLFDLPNQMYGDLTGTVNLSCNGSNSKTCMSTLSGAGTFNASNGRMPKLGSLEYLLKAGNLLKGGITGLSINSLIDLITPLKTGEFSDIYGSINISQGIADDIKISTKGKDLNLYIKGNYNLVTSDAVMYVFGLLSKNIKTPLGAVGNMSLNTLFNLIPGVDLEAESPLVSDINKIPGIELSQKTFRKFIAEIRGDINGDNYVKSFKWIN